MGSIFRSSVILLLAASTAAQPFSKSDIALNSISGFRPNEISSVKLWLDASSITGVSDGAAIATSNWSDKSQSALGNLANAVDCTYRANGGNGRAAVEFNGSTSYARSASFSLAQPFTAFMVLKILGVGGRFIDGVTVNKAILFQAGLPAQIGMFAIAAVQPVDHTTDLGHITLIEANFNGASSTITGNGNSFTTGNPGANGYTDGITLGAAGNLGGGFFSNYQLFDLVLCDSNLSDRQRALIRSHLSQKHGLVTRSLLICDGNSLTSGTGGTPYPDQLLPLIGGTNYWRMHNLGVGGQDTLDMSADAATEVDAKVKNWRKKILVAWEVTNDLVVNGATASAAQDNWLGYCTNRVNAGLTVVTLTVLPRSSFTAQMVTYQGQINTWMRANWQSFSSAIVDVAADSRLSNYSNTTYFDPDGVHLTTAGYSVVAQLVAAAINGM